MERTLVKSLHIGDSAVLVYAFCDPLHKHCAIRVKQMQLQAFPGNPTYELLLLAECFHWGSHVEVPNSQTNIWLVSSLVEWSQAARVRSTAKTCLSRGALLQFKARTCHFFLLKMSPSPARDNIKRVLYTTDLVNVSCDAANAEWIVFGGAPVMQPAWSQVSLHIFTQLRFVPELVSPCFIVTVFAIHSKQSSHEKYIKSVHKQRFFPPKHKSRIT